MKIFYLWVRVTIKAILNRVIWRNYFQNMPYKVGDNVVVLKLICKQTFCFRCSYLTGSWNMSTPAWMSFLKFRFHLYNSSENEKILIFWSKSSGVPQPTPDPHLFEWNRLCSYFFAAWNEKCNKFHGCFSRYIVSKLPRFKLIQAKMFVPTSCSKWIAMRWWIRRQL